MTRDLEFNTEPEHVLALDRMLDAPVEKLWRCWTEPELLERWFCPKPWHASDVRIDLRPGGEFSSVMNGPNGESFVNAGVFLEVEPRRRLVFHRCFRSPGGSPADGPSWSPKRSSRALKTEEPATSPARCTGTEPPSRSMSEWASTRVGASPSISSRRSPGPFRPSGRLRRRPPRVGTCLWFDDQALPAAELYCSLLWDSRIERVTHHPEGQDEGRTGFGARGLTSRWPAHPTRRSTAVRISPSTKRCRLQ